MLDFVVFPFDDEVLVERVEEAFIERWSEPTAAVLACLAAALRPAYPEVAVQARENMAGFGQPVLYVFRDGKAAASTEPAAWLDDPLTARLVHDGSGTYRAANPAAAALFGRPVEAIIGRAAGDFTPPEARIRNAPLLWQRLLSTGRLHSLSVIQAPDERRAVEFVTFRDGDGPRRHVTVMRQVGRGLGSG